jgi:hypothetical protein
MQGAAMKQIFCILAFTFLGVAASDMTMTVAQLKDFIKSSVEKKYPDKEVAEYLRHVKLKNKLDDETVENLQSLGTGPKTTAALHDLRDSTEKLEPPPPPPPPKAYHEADPPDSIEQAKIIDGAREYAMNYEKTLPDFFCAEIQRRYMDPLHHNVHGLDQPEWRLEDTITSKLTYFDHQEKYEVQMVNNASVTNMPMEKLGGAVSRGEFGSMMRYIFDRSSEARFEWDHWGTLRGRRTYVFSFDIDQDHSKYQIVWDNSLELRPAYRGKIYIDQERGMIVRIVESPYDIPSTYPVQAVSDTLDFEFTKIGDGEYLVPMRAVVISATNKYLARNDKEFRLYQKFGTTSTINFGDIANDPLPPEKPEKPEKPPQ